MSKPIIKVENLSKQYRLGARQEAYSTFRESLTGAMKAPLQRLRRNGSTPDDETLWALKDVSFEVQPGEVVGIIGRNGAGKSTLLKVLSRITEPTIGSIKLYGRVASLLEVGTGFHPELTGRENIFLNGAILGMGKREIHRKFDEIVAFAEVEKFIDTPVKRYSSGMYTRLAFSVAAHMDPEILMVDEVLSVGDAAFQKKCLGKMEEVGAQGRTVFFVSHNTPMIARLCSRALLLENGGLKADGATSTVLHQYLNAEKGGLAQRVWPDLKTAPGDEVARLHSVRVLDGNDQLADTIDIRCPFKVELQYWNLQSELRPTAVIHFVDEAGNTLFATNDFNDLTWWNTPREPGLVHSTCHIPGNLLAEGNIMLLAAVTSYNPNRVHSRERDAVSFCIVDQSQGDGARGESEGQWPGLMRPLLKWQVTAETN